jgi:hypothetical protein
MKPEEIYTSLLVAEFSQMEGVTIGKMMSSPGLKYNNKVFAFYHKETMGFRLGNNFSSQKFGLLSAQPLSPFKTKPPLKGWVIVDASESKFWSTLCSMALTYTQTLK